MTKFIISTPCIPGKDMNIADLAGRAIISGEGMFSEASYQSHRFFMSVFLIWRKLDRKRVILSFEGAEQAIYVWINGEFVGYAEDSFTVSELTLHRM